MTSRGWLPPCTSRLKKVACAIGLAAVSMVVLLFCAGRGAPALSANGAGLDGARSSRAGAETGDVSVTWTSTQPVTTVVGRDTFVWPITQHGVTVTFYQDAVIGTAWFTFTPKLKPETELPDKYLVTPYVFDLDGTYQKGGGRVSLGSTGIQIELTYDPSRLTEIELDKLQFFHFGKTEWLPMGGEVDLIAKTVTLRTERTESFAVAGEPPKKYLYLALVMRE